MANSTLLSLFQTTLQGMGVVGYGTPTSVVANTNQDIVQTLALTNIGLKELQKEFDWEWTVGQLIFNATFYTYTGTTTNGSTSLTAMSSIANLDSTFMVTGVGLPQDTFVVSASGTTVVLNQAATASGTNISLTFSKVLYTPPTDFERLVDRTQWDKSKHWEMLGPSTSQQREWLRSGYISTGPRIRYWMMGGYFQIWPPLGANEVLSYEYITKNTVLATGATTVSKQAFSVDTDTCIFPDPLMYALIKLKYFQIKRFDTTDVQRDFNAILDQCKAQDSSSPTLSMAPRVSSVLIGWENIPDSNYGQ